MLVFHTSIPTSIYQSSFETSDKDIAVLIKNFVIKIFVLCFCFHCISWAPIYFHAMSHMIHVME